MRPVPSSLLLGLLIALCGLCAWQWHRETDLRALNVRQTADLTQFQADRSAMETKLNAADAEILRLTGSVNELRTKSVAKTQLDEAMQANAELREKIEKQNAAVLQMNEAIAKQNAAIAQANENITTLTTNRDDLAQRLNDLTARYNKLAKGPAPAPAPVH